MLIFTDKRKQSNVQFQSQRKTPGEGLCFGKSIFLPPPHPSSLQGRLSCIDRNLCLHLIRHAQTHAKATAYAQTKPLNMLSESSLGVPRNTGLEEVLC